MAELAPGAYSIKPFTTLLRVVESLSPSKTGFHHSCNSIKGLKAEQSQGEVKFVKEMLRENGDKIISFKDFIP